MNFSEILKQYMDELNCTGKFLCDETGISKPQLSRYRNGLIVPNADSDVVRDLAAALYKAAQKKKISSITEEQIYRHLSSVLDDDFDMESFRSKFNLLTDVLGINLSAMATYCGYNPSALTRVRTGLRKPRDPFYMCQAIANYVILNFRSATDCRKINELIGIDNSDGLEIEVYKKELFKWLSRKIDTDSTTNDFLIKFDTFDLDEFLRAKKFGKIRIPTALIQFPQNKTYIGEKGMEDGIISFLKATVLSKSSRDVIMYSDHPLDHCVNDEEFVNIWMKGLGAMVMKGIRINIIHNMNRPFHEMMIGLESWIPAYMTGMVSSYYMPETNSGYNHLMLVSGSASLTGDSIKNFPESGRYIFSKANEEVVVNRVRAEQLLSGAERLVDFYDYNRKDQFYSIVQDKLIVNNKTVRSILTAPPIYTMPDDLLERIMVHNKVDDEKRELIKSYIKTKKGYVENYLETGILDQSISIHSKDEMEEYPVSLDLSDLFLEDNIFYDYEDYIDHIRATEDFSESHPNYIFDKDRSADFRNVKITIYNDKYAVVSREKAPTLHLITKHPMLIKALSYVELPIKDK